MSDFKDHFSTRSSAYGRFRPQYPDTLFTGLAALAPGTACAWDCGCGTGQASLGLARHFATVIATDGSAAQIVQAQPGKNIVYRVTTAEASGIEAASVDLVLVAQALHWFDFEAFYREVRRVCRPGGLLAAVAYGLMSITPAVDRVIDLLYSDLVGADWPPERRHIDAGYRTIPFPFARLPDIPVRMTTRWSYDHCLGYLETWSAVKRYRNRTGRDPVDAIAADLLAAWGDRAETRAVVFPLHQLLGRVSGES